jgi:hypothetical protein
LTLEHKENIMPGFFNPEPSMPQSAAPNSRPMTTDLKRRPMKPSQPAAATLAMR